MRLSLAGALGALLIGIWVALSPPEDLGPARFDGSAALPSDPRRHGGFSGLQLTDDGKGFVAVSDRGRVLTGQIVRLDGRLSRIAAGPLRPLLDVGGRPVRGIANDAEGVTRGPDGTLFVSYEGKHRILAYAPGQMIPVAVPSEPAFAGLQSNGGLEALASDSQGRLYTLPERFWQRRGGTPVFRFDAQGWSRLEGYRRTRGFLPVGADVGPDGRLYILERRFPSPAFSSRVRSFAIGDHALTDPKTILTTPSLRHGNLEGLSVWRDEAGDIRLTMVSDDNFISFLPNEIVEYVLPKSLANKDARD